jgi:hypothetical protein
MVGWWAVHTGVARLDYGGGGPVATISERRGQTAPGTRAGSH